MRRITSALVLAVAVGLASVAAVSAGSRAATPVPLKEAKLIVEHNATDHDTGFQGFVDSEGWRRIDVRGPAGAVLSFEGRGSLATLGLTELFFETVEPENADVPVGKTLSKLPAGTYVFSGPTQENGTSHGRTVGRATLSHVIPAGPELVSPAEDAVVPTRGVVARWKPVTRTITGKPVTIVAYQLIIERAAKKPPASMIGKLGLSVYLPPSVTSLPVPDGFLQARTRYDWEVLAIEGSGNQTLSSGSFRTR